MRLQLETRRSRLAGRELLLSSGGCLSPLCLSYVCRDQIKEFALGVPVPAYVFTALALVGLSILFFCLSALTAKPRPHHVNNRPVFWVRALLLWWNSRELRVLVSSFGALLGLLTAALLCVFFQQSSFKEMLPVWSLIVIAGVALRFGHLAGLLGTILAGVTFAKFLFEPLRHLAVQSQAGKNSLIWMILGGLALSGLLGHSPETGKAGKT